MLHLYVTRQTLDLCRGKSRLTDWHCKRTKFVSLTNLGDFFQVWLPYLLTIPIYNGKIKAKQIKACVEKEKVKGLEVVSLYTPLLTVCLICLVYY